MVVCPQVVESARRRQIYFTSNTEQQLLSALLPILVYAATVSNRRGAPRDEQGNKFSLRRGSGWAGLSGFLSTSDKTLSHARQIAPHSIFPVVFGEDTGGEQSFTVEQSSPPAVDGVSSLIDTLFVSVRLKRVLVMALSTTR